MAIGYQIYCTVPGVSQTYFGITTKTLGERFKAHLTKALSGKSNYYIHNAIRKYGVENFQIQQLFTSESFDECKQWEINTISGAKKAGLRLWNCTDGGDGCLGLKHTVEAKQKISRARLGKPPANKGVPMSEEQKKKCSIARIGKSPANKGVPMSKEQKIKLQEAWKRRKLSESYTAQKQKQVETLRATLARRKAAKLLAEAVQTE